MNPWKIAAASILGLFLMVGLARSCGYGEPLVIPDWADSLRVERERYEVERDSLVRKTEQFSLQADSLKREAETWRRRSLAARPARPPRVGTTPPDSGMEVAVSLVVQNVTLQAANDSLWAALDASDSAYSNLEQAYSEQIQATASAMAGWAAADSARVALDVFADRAVRDLTGRLRKAQRGCRVLGLLPCPQISAGYGLTLADGKVRQGPTLSVSIPVRF